MVVISQQKILIPDSKVIVTKQEKTNGEEESQNNKLWMKILTQIFFLGP